MFGSMVSLFVIAAIFFRNIFELKGIGINFLILYGILAILSVISFVYISLLIDKIVQKKRS